MNDDDPVPPEDARISAVWAAYRDGSLAEGLRLAAVATDALPRSGSAWFAAACMHERAGDLMTADRLFARASRCPEDAVGMPCRIGWRAFQREVGAAIESLPAKLHDAAQEVTLVLADYAEPELLEGFSDAEMLGLFMGPTRAERAAGDVPEVSPVIHVFRRAHEHSVATMRELRAELRSTVIHEFGHYLGFDEDDLERLGLD